MASKSSPELSATHSASNPPATRSRDPRSNARAFHGLWWSAADPGWAIYISEQTVQGVNTIFALLAIYSSNGGSTWVVAANTPQGEDGRFVGKLHRPRMAPRASPQAAPYVDEVGTLELVFSTTTAGELRYTLDGVATSKPIQRYLFASDPAICSLPE
jgi:hypothetical protein